MLGTDALIGQNISHYRIVSRVLSIKLAEQLRLLHRLRDRQDFRKVISIVPTIVLSRKRFRPGDPIVTISQPTIMMLQGPAPAAWRF
jgi:hypothetical protein